MSLTWTTDSLVDEQFLETLSPGMRKRCQESRLWLFAMQMGLKNAFYDCW